ncbi:MAG: hypothetical protein WCE69_15010 [Aestuariivirga sp.]
MMNPRVSLLSALLFASANTSALAVTASPEEAARLTGVFQTYLGQEPGVVTVTPAGEAYDVKIDFTPLIAKVKKPNFSAAVSPVLMKLADQGGGKWLITQDSPLSYSAKVPGQLDMMVKIGALKSSAVFDQNLSTFITSTADITDIVVDETMTSPEATSMHVAYNVKAMHYETTATAAGAGASDSTFHMAMSGMTETIGVPMSPSGGQPMDITVTAETGTQDGTITGFKAQAIYKLIAWFVAHPSEETIKANQAELKTLLGAGLPLFTNVTTTGALQNLSVTTPVGPVGIASLGFDVGMNGVVADGMLHEGFRAEGLTLPPGLVPPFAADLVPQSFALDFKVTDFNLADPAKMLLEVMDLNETKPTTPEEDAKLLTALLPKGTVEISMGPSKVTSKLYELGFEGALTAGPVGVPVGVATVRAKGLDEVMKALQAAPPEMAGQAIPGLIAAKGMAKTESDGSLSWKIENTISGGLLVNGIDVTKMGGG